MPLHMSAMSLEPDVTHATILGQQPVLLSSAVVSDRKVGTV